MEASTTGAPPITTAPTTDPLTEKIKRTLQNKGIPNPTPKIIHTLRKKHLQKALRKAKKSPIQPLSKSQQDIISHETHFRNVSNEYKRFSTALDKSNDLVGRPWESLDRVKFMEVARKYVDKEELVGGKLKNEHLSELGFVFEQRMVDEGLEILLDDDVEVDEGLESGNGVVPKRQVGEFEAVGILVQRLSAREITMKDWKFTRIMKQSGLPFTEHQMLKIVGGLGERRCWKQAMEVVGWVYGRKEHRHYKSRFVYTKLLAVLGKARRPNEALKIFNHMRGDCHIYPDMAAYHSIAVTLGQAGMVRELMGLIECLKEKPAKSIRNLRSKNWDPTLQPDVVVFNSVLNACVTSHHWKGVAWVFQQLRKSGLQANSATYGLAMEVMLHSSKYEQVYEFFEKMKRSGKSLNALTYRVLVKTFWKEGKVDEAVHVVRDMEQRGVTGSGSVYYELACCLCNNGRWQEAMIEISKLKKLWYSKPLAVAFTGMILSALDGGHVDDCTSIFEHLQDHCLPNIGTVNAMLKVYARNDMFLEAKELFEKAKTLGTGDGGCLGDADTPLVPDLFTYGLMLEVSGHAQQWEYFEYIYKEMCFLGYQLDQGKHAVLLVEASKAGKWHLLEHAFDATLEAGEIPHPILFTEMVCQSIFQDDYEKAIAILNAMAHAPFKFDKKDWISLFEKNKDRITNDHLKRLSDTLCNRDMPEEFTISELLSALHSVCGSIPVDGQCAAGSDIMNASSSNADSLDSFTLQSANTHGMKALAASRGQQLQTDNFDHDQLSFSPSSDMESVVDNVFADFLNCDSDEDDRVGSCDYPPVAVDMAHDDYKQNIFDEVDPPDISFSQVDDLPSAEEILQSWKKIRRKHKSDV